MGTADHHGLSQNVSSGSADVGAGDDDLTGLKLHGAGGVADLLDLAVGFDVVTGVHGSQELHVVVGTEQALIAIALDQQLRGDITEQVDHVGAVHQISAVMSILGAHTQAKHRSHLFHKFFLLQNFGRAISQTPDPAVTASFWV